MNIDYTLWPNVDGQLGKNKVAIPDGVTIQWPEGDALIGDFIYKDNTISGFVDVKALIVNNSKTSTIPYDVFKIQLDKSLEGTMTFVQGERCKYFTVTYENYFTEETFKYKGCKTVDDIKTIEPNYLTVDIIDGVWNERLDDLENGQSMFIWNKSLTSFEKDLFSLKNGNGMFRGCSNLTHFKGDLSSITSTSFMFASCTNLNTFDSILNSLEIGFYTFEGCSNLKSFNVDMPSLTEDSGSFEDCVSLTSFESDLSSLTVGDMTFYGCSSLTNFRSDLRSLYASFDMFTGCKLNTASIKNIAETIGNGNPNLSEMSIGIQSSSPTSEEISYFNLMTSKGWTVYVNGSYVYNAEGGLEPPPINIDEEVGDIPTIIPFYAKPILMTGDFIKYAKYVDENGNYYRIVGGQYVYGDDLSSYGMFTSLEDAAANMRLTKIEKSL